MKKSAAKITRDAAKITRDAADFTRIKRFTHLPRLLRKMPQMPQILPAFSLRKKGRQVVILEALQGMQKKALLRSQSGRPCVFLLLLFRRCLCAAYGPIVR